MRDVLVLSSARPDPADHLQHCQLQNLQEDRLRSDAALLLLVRPIAK